MEALNINMAFFFISQRCRANIVFVCPVDDLFNLALSCLEAKGGSWSDGRAF